MKNQSQIRVIDRAFTLLFFMAHEKRPMGVTEIARGVNLPKATVYRILDSLAVQRMVIEREGSYEMGPATLFLADAYRSQVAFAEVARPFLEKLNRGTKETVHLFIFEKGELFYLDKLESPYQVRMHSRVGVKGSLTRLSAGQAILSCLPKEEVIQFLGEEATPGLFSELQKIQNRGYAIDDEENEKGLRCVGAAIMDAHGDPVGAISISAPVYRLDFQVISQYGEEVCQTAKFISEALIRYEKERNQNT
ncbi:MAG TPA: IclR family transcriptional regulator [Aminobacterium sp.]|jgi:DNA-binding IclR family transcriptional regulator|uniref:IclR family transcriptional regulator n=1 Tax=Aminobacterium TaxID=81466 RepID=UPI0004675560|nr:MULTISPECIES: IclR family transcriptional regulator [Aminobacterium]HCA40699.1 IclR family transcriptional regulator [Aminobacterium sp.]